MNTLIQRILFIIIGLILGYFFFNQEDPNNKLTYGQYGDPKNCRAIIKSNYEGWYLEKYTAEGALDSINRNCGQFGYAWNK